MKTRYSETRIQKGFFKSRSVIVSGYIPSGLEYFQSSYQGRPVEYCVYRDEREDNPNKEVDITYLDVATSEAVEMGVALLSDLE